MIPSYAGKGSGGYGILMFQWTGIIIIFLCMAFAIWQVKMESPVPPMNVRVLVFDKLQNKWRIGRVEERTGTTWWVFDPHIFESPDANRFIAWQDLPRNP